MILYVGATGLLGNTAVQELIKRGKTVRCLVRPSTDVSSLEKLDIEFVRVNLQDETALDAALQGVTTIISSFATNIAKQHLVSALWENDYEGNCALIRRARTAGVKKFIFTSYWGLAKFGGFEHGKIKKMVEDLLTVSGLDYTILRITSLATDMSMLTGTTLRKRGWAPMLMKPHEKIRPILLDDLAWCMADAIDNPKACRRIIEVAGVEEYNFREFEKLFCRTLNKKVRFIFVPLPLATFIAGCVDWATKNQNNARGIVSAFTGGSTCNIAEMQQVFSIKQGSFAAYLEDFFRNRPA